MKILGLETTCDETACSILENRKVLANVIFSQVFLHKEFNGVVPELASRAHLEKISFIIKTGLEKAGYSLPLSYNRDTRRMSKGTRIDAVVFARGPGLPGALLVGRVAAETISRIFNAKLIGVNHLEGHFLAAELSGDRIVRNIDFPVLALIVSGGHTEIWKVLDYGRYMVLGRTRDDAAGEAFDKVAKLLNLGYPGGPVIEKMAQKGNPDYFRFPRPYLEGSFDFSFSGLKTAVCYYLREKTGYRVEGRGDRVEDLSKKEISDICASFQEAVVDTLIYKTKLASEKFQIRRIVVGGGVAANLRLREKFNEKFDRNFKIYFVDRTYCTDNAAMISLCGYRRLLSARKFSNSTEIDPELKIENWKN